MSIRRKKKRVIEWTTRELDYFETKLYIHTANDMPDKWHGWAKNWLSFLKARGDQDTLTVHVRTWYEKRKKKMKNVHATDFDWILLSSRWMENHLPSVQLSLAKYTNCFEHRTLLLLGHLLVCVPGQASKHSNSTSFFHRLKQHTHISSNSSRTTKILAQPHPHYKTITFFYLILFLRIHALYICFFFLLLFKKRER